MRIQKGPPFAARVRRTLLLLVAVGCVLLPRVAAAQGLTGTLIGTVKDEQGLVLAGARVSISSPALIGGSTTLTTNERGRLRFPVLPPGLYELDIEMPGFAPLHETRHPHWGWRHHRKNGRSEACRRRRVRSWCRERARASTPRDPGFGTALRLRGHRHDPDAASQHVRLDQGRPWHLADFAVKWYRDDHLRVRLRHQ